MGGGGSMRQVILIGRFADVTEEIGSGSRHHNLLLLVILRPAALLQFSLVQLAEKLQVFRVPVKSLLVLL
jgi:hypothetical protein